MASQGIDAYFTTDEIARLEDGLPDLAEWSAHILVPFRACRLRNARVVWLNHRWFAERQFDLDKRDVRDRVGKWILSDFAYVASTSINVSVHISTEDDCTLYADRYGSPDGLTPHGGSGRVATVGRFQAKGIGQTPLVGSNAAAGHSHGYMSLSDAVREAIFSEVAAAEFPYGAVPVVAIIDTGLTFSSPDIKEKYDQNVRRAILVRPSAIRIAHMERAPLFRESVTGFVNVQMEDALRTREMMARWMADAVSTSSLDEEIGVLRQLLESIVEQIAFGQVYRIFCGGYFSSNLTISGALLDFGNMHALPDWTYARTHSVVDGFGREMVVLRSLVNSLAFYVTKYRRRGGSLRLGSELYENLKPIYQSAWQRLALALFNVSGDDSTALNVIYEPLWRYFNMQQQRPVRYRFGRTAAASAKVLTHWLYDGIVMQRGDSLRAQEVETLDAIDKILRRTMTSRQRAIAWCTAARLLKPRLTLDRGKLLDELAEITKISRGPVSPRSIDDYIHAAIDGGRRHWPRLPHGRCVLGHVTRGGSSALMLRRSADGQAILWLEGVIGADNTLIFFDQRLDASEATSLAVRRYQKYWSAVVDTHEEGGELYTTVATRNIRIPPMTVSYDAPAQRWLS